MRQSHRIYHESIDNNGDRTRWILWTGGEYPSHNAIRIAALRAQDEEHDSFQQAIDDYISVQKKRRIGWQTLDVINIFEIQK